MTMRVDHVSIALTGYIEFEGTRILRMDFAPTELDDALVAALLMKNQMLLLAAAKAEGEAKGIL